MVLNDVKVERYEKARVSIQLEAGSLEMYDADKIWAAENVSFIQYAADGSGTVESSGFAALMLVDDKAEVYTLGKETEVHLISDNLLMKASDLKWSKKTNRLSGSKTGEVEIAKDDGSLIRGTGFFADTLSRSYDLSRTVSGQLVTGKPAEDESVVDPNSAGQTGLQAPTAESAIDAAKL